MHNSPWAQPPAASPSKDPPQSCGLHMGAVPLFHPEPVWKLFPEQSGQGSLLLESPQPAVHLIHCA